MQSHNTCLTRTLFFSEGGFLVCSQSQDSKDSFAPTVPPKMMGYVDDNNSSQSEQTYELPVYNDTYMVSWFYSSWDGDLGGPPCKPEPNLERSSKLVTQILAGYSCDTAMTYSYNSVLKCASFLCTRDEIISFFLILFHRQHLLLALTVSLLKIEL